MLLSNPSKQVAAPRSQALKPGLRRMHASAAVTCCCFMHMHARMRFVPIPFIPFTTHAHLVNVGIKYAHIKQRTHARTHTHTHTHTHTRNFVPFDSLFNTHTHTHTHTHIYTYTHIHTQVDQLLDALALTRCAGVRIGSPEARGISGGQAKRTNIAIALITDPRVLFLGACRGVGDFLGG